jgi:DNA-directed RNA polymerase subunit L
MLHRVGLVPIHFSEDETENFISDDYEFELNVMNKSNVIANVTSRDFTVLKNGTALPDKELHRLFPLDTISKSPILITRLRQGETLHVKGRAIKSTAGYHAGFSPVSLCTLSFKQDPLQIQDHSGNNAQSSNVLAKERAYFKNSYGDPTIIKFDLEGETALSPKYLVSKSLDILTQKLFKIVEEIYKEDSEYVTFTFNTAVASDATGNGSSDEHCKFTFKGEDDTLGNFLQSMMHNYYVRDKKPTVRGNKIVYVGYYCPHPLDNTMVLRFNFESTEHSHMDYINAFKEHCERSIAYLQNIQTEWMQAAISNLQSASK